MIIGNATRDTLNEIKFRVLFHSPESLQNYHKWIQNTECHKPPFWVMSSEILALTVLCIPG